jgi:hypothetical protein
VKAIGAVEHGLFAKKVRVSVFGEVVANFS